MAAKSGELMRANQDVLNRTGLAPTWASLLALAHQPPRSAAHVSAELAAKEQQVAALRQQLQKQTQRVSRHKERARQLQVRPSFPGPPLEPPALASVNVHVVCRSTDHVLVCSAVSIQVVTHGECLPNTCFPSRHHACVSLLPPCHPHEINVKALQGLWKLCERVLVT